MDINLNNVQHEPIVVTGDLTAANNRYYVNTASATYTDPTPAAGKGFIVFIRNGTATIGGTAYSSVGSVIYRYYHSGTWATYENFDNIIVQTAAQWAADSTVYSNKKILITSDEYYGTTNQRKFKIADGTNTWSALSYFGVEFDTLNLYGNLNLTGNGDVISLTGNTNNLDTGETMLVYLDANGDYNLTGIADGEEGQAKILYNDDSANIITLKNNTTSSTTNRFDFYPASDVTLNPKQYIILLYISSRWRYFGGSGSSGVTSVTGTAPIVSSGGATPVISITQASTSTNGYLSSGDYTSFSFDNSLFSIYRSGQYLSGNTFTGFSAATGWTIDRIRAIPFPIAENVTISAIRIEVTTNIASSKARLGIYSDSNGYPGALLVDGGEVDCSSLGLKEVSISQALTKSMKRVWLAVNISHSTIGFRTGTAAVHILGRPSAGGTKVANSYMVTSTYGALPSTYPAGGTEEASAVNTFLIEAKIS